ncbi:tetratricopeptide repeat protein [Butyricimonas faecalis]|jgi:hypothetical protein|uniref:Tetratricopeptide repeat protein n=1 Tax=Butyricimonas faecalis TaxID=2093856 RepID=A0A3Q9IPF0_9BACT|nr:hypothetical protein [Butyricimonas faecalis]AZS29942.1 tetratricopeptide repeat protein [Butyricimonas faecalis]MBS7154637.1 hypothetical protein [Sanguibacteroides justesenii]
MKKTLGFIAVVALSGLITVSCSSLKKMKKRAGEITYSVTPETLVAKGGMVDLKIDVTFPAKYFNKKVAIEATPVLRFKGGEKAYEMKAIQGEKVQGNAEVIPYETGKTVSYTSRIPYEDAMRLSDLEIDITGSKGAKTAKFDPRKIGDGVIATETLVVNAPATSVGEDKFQRIIKQQEEAAIYYLINSANIRSKEMTSEEMKKLEAYIKEAATKENMNLNGIDVRSYASPDGAYDFNEKLANQREKNSSAFLKKQMKKGKVEQYKDENFFKDFVVAEDWDGFKKAMEESNIQDKELILRVLSMHSDPEVREREIRNIASAFAVVADQILPKLRRSLFVVNTELIGKSDDELKALAKSNPSDLNVEELLYSATLFDNNNDKLAIYEACMRQFPNDWRGFNDAGMIQFEMGNIAAAQANFNKANSMSANNPVVQNNLGAVALKNGDLKQAEVYFGAATGAGQEVNYNKGIVAIKSGDYAAAVNYFGQCNCVNAALANVLAGNNNEALKKLNAENKECPMSYYLKAVIGARTNDATAVIENLKKACSLDASFKQLAATDMEFVKFFENNDFVTITK